MPFPQSLNDIGSGIMIESRSGSWSVRFRLPPAIQEKYNLPRLPRLITENIRGNLSDPKHRATALRREANRIGAKLDLLLHGYDAPGPGETLAHWLGLAESNRVRHNSKRRVPRSKTWQYLAQLYIDEFKDSTIAREINEADAVRRFEHIRDLDFCQDRFPPDIKPEEWDEYFDGLMRDRPTSSGGKTTSLVLDASNFEYGDTALPGNVLTCAHVSQSLLHDSAHPDQLASFFIRLASREGGIVLDPFAGSGTTLVAAKRLGRRWLGYEVRKSAFHAAMSRLEWQDERQ